MKTVWLLLVFLALPGFAFGQQKMTAGQQRYDHDVKLLAAELEAANKKHASFSDAHQIGFDDSQLVQISGLIMALELNFMASDSPRRTIDEIDRLPAVTSVIKLHDDMAQAHAHDHCRLNDTCGSNR